MNPRWIVAVYILNEHQRFSPSRRALGTGDPLQPSLPSALRFDAASRYGATSATDFTSKFIRGGGDKSRLHEKATPLSQTE
jgi:hypothetical protein